MREPAPTIWLLREAPAGRDGAAPPPEAGSGLPLCEPGPASRNLPDRVGRRDSGVRGRFWVRVEGERRDDRPERALDRGVKKTHIVDARLPHALLLEFFTDQGVGTQIIKA